MNRALAQTVMGVSASDFAPHECAISSRRGRRALRASGATITTTVAVDASQHDDDVSASVGAAVAAALSDGSLASSITAIASESGTSTFDGVSIDSATLTTQNPTQLPTPLPTSSPTPSPTQIPTASPTVAPTPSPTAVPSRLPTATPSQSPTPSPTAVPSRFPTATPTPAPTAVPIPAPTAMPVPAPTQVPILAPTPRPSSAAITVAPLSLHISAISCEEYGSSEENAVNEALRDAISGAISFTAHACTDVGGVADGRRLLSTSSDALVVETDATVRDAAYSGSAASKDDIVSSVQSTLADSVASGALSDAIIDAIATLDPSSPLRAAEFSATMAPSSSPPADSSCEMPGWTPFLAFVIPLVITAPFVYLAYEHHHVKPALSKVSVVFMVLSAPDFILDCCWVHQRQLCAETFFYDGGLAILIIACALNTAATFMTIWMESKTKRFDANKFHQTYFGVPYMLGLVLSCTNTDVLMLLPWKCKNAPIVFVPIDRGTLTAVAREHCLHADDPEFKNTELFKRTGFPSAFVLLLSFIRLVEDIGQAIMQTMYTSQYGGDALTWLSLLTSWLGVFYLIMFKLVVWLTSTLTTDDTGGDDAKVNRGDGATAGAQLTVASDNDGNSTHIPLQI